MDNPQDEFKVDKTIEKVKISDEFATFLGKSSGTIMPRSEVVRE